MRCPTGGDEFCGDAHGIVDRNGETQTDRSLRCGVRAFRDRRNAASDELMPMSRPFSSTSGPPELPALIAALVWIGIERHHAVIGTDTQAIPDDSRR